MHAWHEFVIYLLSNNLFPQRARGPPRVGTITALFLLRAHAPGRLCKRQQDMQKIAVSDRILPRRHAATDFLCTQTPLCTVSRPPFPSLCMAHFAETAQSLAHQSAPVPSSSAMPGEMRGSARDVAAQASQVEIAQWPVVASRPPLAAPLALPSPNSSSL